MTELYRDAVEPIDMKELMKDEAKVRRIQHLMTQFMQFQWNAFKSNEFSSPQVNAL